MSHRDEMYADFVLPKLQVLVDNVEQLVDVMNEEMNQRVTLLDVIDWLSECGLTLTRPDVNDAHFAYRTLLEHPIPTRKGTV